MSADLLDSKLVEPPLSTYADLKTDFFDNDELYIYEYHGIIFPRRKIGSWVNVTPFFGLIASAEDKEKFGKQCEKLLESNKATAFKRLSKGPRYNEDFRLGIWCPLHIARRVAERWKLDKKLQPILAFNRIALTKYCGFTYYESFAMLSTQRHMRLLRWEHEDYGSRINLVQLYNIHSLLKALRNESNKLTWPGLLKRMADKKCDFKEAHDKTPCGGVWVPLSHARHFAKAAGIWHLVKHFLSFEKEPLDQLEKLAPSRTEKKLLKRWKVHSRGATAFHGLPQLFALDDKLISKIYKKKGLAKVKIGKLVLCDRYTYNIVDHVTEERRSYSIFRRYSDGYINASTYIAAAVDMNINYLNDRKPEDPDMRIPNQLWYKDNCSKFKNEIVTTDIDHLSGFWCSPESIMNNVLAQIGFPKSNKLTDFVFKKDELFQNGNIIEDEDDLEIIEDEKVQKELKRRSKPNTKDSNTAFYDKFIPDKPIKDEEKYGTQQMKEGLQEYEDSMIEEDSDNENENQPHRRIYVVSDESDVGSGSEEFYNPLKIVPGESEERPIAQRNNIHSLPENDEPNEGDLGASNRQKKDKIQKNITDKQTSVEVEDEATIPISQSPQGYQDYKSDDVDLATSSDSYSEIEEITSVGLEKESLNEKLETTSNLTAYKSRPLGPESHPEKNVLHSSVKVAVGSKPADYKESSPIITTDKNKGPYPSKPCYKEQRFKETYFPSRSHSAMSTERSSNTDRAVSPIPISRGYDSYRPAKAHFAQDNNNSNISRSRPTTTNVPRKVSVTGASGMKFVPRGASLTKPRSSQELIAQGPPLSPRKPSPQKIAASNSAVRRGSGQPGLPVLPGSASASLAATNRPWSRMFSALGNPADSKDYQNRLPMPFPNGAPTSGPNGTPGLNSNGPSHISPSLQNPSRGPPHGPPHGALKRSSPITRPPPPPLSSRPLSARPSSKGSPSVRPPSVIPPSSRNSTLTPQGFPHSRPPPPPRSARASSLSHPPLSSSAAVAAFSRKRQKLENHEARSKLNNYYFSSSEEDESDAEELLFSANIMPNYKSMQSNSRISSTINSSINNNKDDQTKTQQNEVVFNGIDDTLVKNYKQLAHIDGGMKHIDVMLLQGLITEKAKSTDTRLLLIYCMERNKLMKNAE